MAGWKLGIVICLLHLAATVSVGAQVVVGKVVDGEGQPLRGAFITLLFEDSVTASSLSRRDGTYAVRVPLPGQYTLRAERIGFETVTASGIELSSGRTYERDVTLAERPVALDGIGVRAESRCGPPQAGGDLARIWGEARKALRVVDWSSQGSDVRFRSSTYRRRLGADGRRVGSEEEETREIVGAPPFVSAPVEQLERRGYMLGAPTDARYFAPDAQVLLSDQFVEDHCFRLTRETDRVGLAFNPVEDHQELVDVAGTLWLALPSLELRELHFEFWGLKDRLLLDPDPWLPRRGRPDRPEPGGRVLFSRLPSGLWYVEDWTLRMPVIGYEQDELGGSRRVLAGFEEVGGRVRSVQVQQQRTAVAPMHRGGIEGTVKGEAAGHPLSNVLLYLSGTQHDVRSGPDGTFTFENLRPGRYTLVADGPVEAREVEVEVRAGEISPVEISWEGDPPGRADTPVMAAAASISQGEGSGPGVILGYVRDLVTDRPVAEAEVALVTHDDSVWVRGATNRAGEFYLRTDKSIGLTVRIRSLGYQEHRAPLAGIPGVQEAREGVRLEIGLPPAPLVVDGVVARVDAEVLPGHLVRAGFFERQRNTTGYLKILDDVERAQAHRMSDFLSRVPGVRMDSRGGLQGMEPRVRGALGAEMGRKCYPSVFIDGALVRRFGTGLDERVESVPFDNILSPNQLLAFEVYTSVAKLPSQFGGYLGQCGVVLLWTR